jgi:MOSC domain-containing protein
MNLHITELWRYPVKSMAGERLKEADVLEDGIVGDRVVHVVNDVGRVVTSRTNPVLLSYRATLGGDGGPLINGRPWRDVEVPVGNLVRDDGVERFDVLPLLVATDGAIAAFGHDGRRLRPNIVIGGVEGLAERGWEGRQLRAGEVVIGIQDLRERCIMTTFDPDTQEQDVDVLRKIRREFAGLLALNCYVIKPGKLAVGDPVELVTSI